MPLVIARRIALAAQGFGTGRPDGATHAGPVRRVVDRLGLLQIDSVNVLEDEEDNARALARKKILYAPDYVLNAGGLINVYSELKGYPREKAMQDAANIFDTVKRVINKAKVEGSTTAMAANRVAEERIAAVRRFSDLYMAKMMDIAEVITTEAAITAKGGSVTIIPLPYASGRPPAKGNQFTNR